MSSLRSILVLTLLLTGCNAEPSWKELSLPSDSVRVQLPGTWKEKPAPDGQGRVYQAIHGRTEYLLGIHNIPERSISPDEARQALRVVRDDIVSRIEGGKLTAQSDTELDGKPGIEFEAKGTTETARARLFLTNRSMVTTMIAYKNPAPSQANAEKFFQSLAFNLSAPVATASTPIPPPPVPAPATANNTGEDKRNAWRYTNAPQIFPDQHGYNGVIRKTTGITWVDETEKGPLEFLEDVRTREYVELKRPVGDFRVRLYDDHSEYKFGYSPKWEQMFPGKWE